MRSHKQERSRRRSEDEDDYIYDKHCRVGNLNYLNETRPQIREKTERRRRWSDGDAPGDGQKRVGRVQPRDFDKRDLVMRCF